MVASSTSVSPDPSHNLQDVLGEARSILVQAGNPRAVLQAYNTFQARWGVIQARQLETKVDARTLVVLLLLQYAWREVFTRIFYYPHLFFYLHALTTAQPNSICSATELDELYDLGAPTVTSDSPLKEFRRPELAQLFRALTSLPTQLNDPNKAVVDSLMLHISLVTEVSPLGNDLEEPWTALISGDPARIRFAARASGRIQQDLLPLLFGQLAVLSARTPQNDVRDDEEPLQVANRAIFALGRVSGEIATKALLLLAQSPETVPPAILSRLIYALAHHASAEPPQSLGESALEALADMVNNDRIDDANRIRAARLLRYCPKPDDDSNEQRKRPFNERLTEILSLLKPEWPRRVSGILQTTIRESLLQSDWLSDALWLMDPNKFDPEEIHVWAVETNRQKKDWPERIGEHLAQLAHKKERLSEEAFQLLGSYHSRTDAIRWLTLLACISDSYRNESLKKIAELQKSIADWQKPAWKELEEFITSRNKEDELMALCRALGDAVSGPKEKYKNEEAVSAIRRLHSMGNTRRWREQVREILEELSDRDISEAKKALSEIVNEPEDHNPTGSLTT